ncbi:MAG: helix-turn-helix domain-containing protein, partial [Candidatus Marinimicrobia bacterium]|nr:helix-turn-helix domain-containing protein [Candidatus Neomarinimicrobiota bacterium]
NAQACRDFNIPDSSFYEWKKAYEKEGKAGLRRKKPVAYSHPKKIPVQVVEKILQIRRDYQLGPERIMWYLERYHGISVSESTVYRIQCPIIALSLHRFFNFSTVAQSYGIVGVKR